MEIPNTFEQGGHHYLIDPGLQAAVEIALDLGMPLLVTGEPGTGKTKLANYVAEQMLQCELLEFYTKTTSKARDLLYKYNALTHFRDSQRTEGEVNPMAYVAFEALGRAILDSPSKRHVVLIDEIDKAPRDFPNDVLFEFEHLAFRVEEASAPETMAWATATQSALPADDQGFFRFDRQTGNRPVLILTSNSEKNLPDAFLRRCVYYHIPFPEKERLTEIVNVNLPLSQSFRDNMLEHAIQHFLDIRNRGLRKKPATAELIAWIHLLNQKGIDLRAGLGEAGDEALREQIRRTYTVLCKNREDRERVLEDLER